MDYQYFDSLSRDDAHAYLRHFGEEEADAIHGLRPAAERAGLVIDFSPASLPGVLKWLISNVRCTRVAIPSSEPEWVRNVHKAGLIQFDQESKIAILRAAYYLGECLVRSFPTLRWTIGDVQYAEKNMPVVAGFRGDLEMAPLMVMENVSKRIMNGGSPDEIIGTLVDTWLKDAR